MILLNRFLTIFLWKEALLRIPKDFLKIILTDFCSVLIKLKTMGMEKISPKWMRQYRISHPEEFCKIGILRNFPKFTGKHLCQSLFFKVAIVLQLYLKRYSDTVVFLWIFAKLRIPKNTFFHRKPPLAASNNSSQRSLFYISKEKRKFYTENFMNGLVF